MKYLAHLCARDVSGTRAVILPIPFNESVRYTNDTAKAPAYLEKHGLSHALASVGFVVSTHPAIHEKRVARMVSVARTIVAQALRHEQKCIALGGTHTIALGTIGGALEVLGNDLGVIWIDAHGDLNTHEVSLTGDTRGMVLAALLGIDSSPLAGLVKKKLKSKNLLHVGLKDVEVAEVNLIRKHRLNVVTAENIARVGLVDCAKRIEGLAKKVKYVWVSLDIDAIDKDDAPASPMASKGGLTYREITHIMKYIGHMCCVVGMDIVEVAPKKDIQGKTARLCIELAASVLGASHTWYTSYMRKYAKR